MNDTKRVRVKMLESVAGLKDPDREALDRKYKGIVADYEARALKNNREVKPHLVKALIDEHKRQDRYDDVCRGFKRDFAFAPGSEPSIPIEVAQKWEEAGLCTILPDEPPAKRAA